jgi:hypothetical protein
VGHVNRSCGTCAWHAACGMDIDIAACSLWLVAQWLVCCLVWGFWDLRTEVSEEPRWVCGLVWAWGYGAGRLGLIGLLGLAASC